MLNQRAKYGHGGQQPDPGDFVENERKFLWALQQQLPRVSYQVLCPHSGGMFLPGPVQGQGRGPGLKLSLVERKQHRTNHEGRHPLTANETTSVTHQTPQLTPPRPPEKQGAAAHTEPWPERMGCLNTLQQWGAGTTAVSQAPLSLACCKEQWTRGRWFFCTAREKSYFFLTLLKLTGTKQSTTNTSWKIKWDNI